MQINVWHDLVLLYVREMEKGNFQRWNLESQIQALNETKKTLDFQLQKDQQKFHSYFDLKVKRKFRRSVNKSIKRLEKQLKKLT